MTQCFAYAEEMGQWDANETDQYKKDREQKAIKEDGAHGNIETSEVFGQNHQQIGSHNNTQGVNGTTDHLVFVVLPDELVEAIQEVLISAMRCVIQWYERGKNVCVWLRKLLQYVVSNLGEMLFHAIGLRTFNNHQYLISPQFHFPII